MMHSAETDPVPKTVAECATTRDLMRLGWDVTRRLLAGDITPKEANAITKEANRKLRELEGK